MIDERQRRDIVVIGASLGGVQALRHLVASIPVAFSGSVFLILHRGAHAASVLPQVLRGRSAHTIVEPVDMQPIEKGRIHLAPRDVHMTIEDGRLRVLRGPKEHFTRPAVDPLFRSAAAAYGRRVVGVVLTGGGYDGFSGLIAIKAAGGLGLVQRPSEALSPSMPMHAIRQDHPDAVLTLEEISKTLASLMNGANSQARQSRVYTQTASSSPRLRTYHAGIAIQPAKPARIVSEQAATRLWGTANRVPLR